MAKGIFLRLDQNYKNPDPGGPLSRRAFSSHELRDGSWLFAIFDEGDTVLGMAGPEVLSDLEVVNPSDERTDMIVLRNNYFAKTTTLAKVAYIEAIHSWAYKYQKGLRTEAECRTALNVPSP